MLFNSLEFLFLFLPVSLLIFYLLGQWVKKSTALTWLVLCSLFFYGSFKIDYLILFIGSLAFNFFVGKFLCKKNIKESIRNTIFFIAVSTNLLLLIYYKFFDFFVENVEYLTGNSYNFASVILPIGISFFSFQQIAFLFDCKKQPNFSFTPSEYFGFISFFPQLVAGPIMHHEEAFPQFRNKKFVRFSDISFAKGLGYVAIGLFKKIVLADNIGKAPARVFAAAEKGVAISTSEAWMATLGDSIQFYLDISAYSDIAIGLGLLFGIRIPFNFASPLKAPDMIEYIRRWHMTVARFLRDHIYIPLGGNRKGTTRKYMNIMITLFFSGMWHGAGWGFIIWGVITGVIIVINHAWRELLKNREIKIFDKLCFSLIGFAMNFTFVTMLRVPYAGKNANGWKGLFMGQLGFTEGDPGYVVADWFQLYLVELSVLEIFNAKIGSFYLIALGTLFCLLFPCTGELMEGPDYGRRNWSIIPNVYWKPNLRWGIFIGLTFVAAVGFLDKPSIFLYFNV